MSKISPPPKVPSSVGALPAAPSFPSAGECEWVRVLRSCGWPTDCVVIDFETYFDADYTLKKMSIAEYLEDSRFSVQGFAAITVRGQLPFGEPAATWWTDAKGQVGYLQAQYGEHLERCTVIMQNAAFDAAVLARKYHVFCRNTVDIINLSRHLDARNRHNLADLCKRHGVRDKGDTAQFSGLRWPTMTQDQHIMLAEYAKNDAEIEWALFTKLLPRLTQPQTELALANHTLQIYLRPSLVFDFAAADKLRSDMQQVLDDIIHKVGADVTPTLLRSEKGIKSLAGAIGLELPTKPGKKKATLALAKTDLACQALLKHPDQRVRDLIEARLAVKSWPNHISRVANMTAQARASGGKLPIALRYYGAHTGRWSGTEGINPQNWGARGHTLLKQVRGLVSAPEGHRLVVVDSAQIEARGTGWIAGQTDLLGAFADGRDVYSEFAADLLAQPVRKPAKTDPAPVAKLLAGRRALGKVGILGLGYGMGADRALDYMRTYPELTAKVESGEIDILFAARMVQYYRTRYPKIVDFWHKIERAFSHVTQWGGIVECGRLVLSREGTTTIIRLPSDRCLFYPHAAVANGRLSYHWGKLWGGVLTENIVQAFSRDILGEAMLRIEARYPIVLHAHDEVAAMALATESQKGLAFVARELSRRPAWAADLPLDAEGHVTQRYAKP